MKTRYPLFRRGFTLIELLVAMAITTLIVTVLVSITAVATDTWSRSRSELRASRQAKTMVDIMAKDFESMVTRRNNSFEWLVAKHPGPDELPGNTKLKSANAAELVFFTAPTDRYGGKLTDPDSKGDVCGVGYMLEYKDPFLDASADPDAGFPTFILKRHVVDPGDSVAAPKANTFDDLLGKPDLLVAFQAFENELSKSESFVCENVYQFTVVFHVEVPGRTIPVQVMVGEEANMVTKFSFKGTGIVTDGLPSGVTAEELKSGRMVGVEVSLSVLKDSAINRVRKGVVPTDPTELAKFLTANCHNYSKFIKLSSL